MPIFSQPNFKTKFSIKGHNRIISVQPIHKTDDFSVIMSAQCGPSQMHMEHAQSTQFYAPTKALIQSCLYPTPICVK